MRPRESGPSLEKEPTRAQRFPLHLSLRYRPVGDAVWHDGRTENISRSGVLFRAEDLLGVATPIEMTFALPGAQVGPNILCQGRIVRTVPSLERKAGPVLAATIEDYHFVRGQYQSR